MAKASLPAKSSGLFPQARTAMLRRPLFVLFPATLSLAAGPAPAPEPVVELTPLDVTGTPLDLFSKGYTPEIPQPTGSKTLTVFALPETPAR